MTQARPGFILGFGWNIRQASKLLFSAKAAGSLQEKGCLEGKLTQWKAEPVNV